MREAVIVSTARTALTKAARGAFNNTHGIKLAAHSIEHAIARAGIDPAEVDDVILGNEDPRAVCQTTGTMNGESSLHEVYEVLIAPQLHARCAEVLAACTSIRRT